MPNDYSIEIHKYFSEKIAEAEKSIRESVVESSHYQGQIEELHWLRKYLSNNIDLKDFPYY